MNLIAIHINSYTLLVLKMAYYIGLAVVPAWAEKLLPSPPTRPPPAKAAGAVGGDLVGESCILVEDEENNLKCTLQMPKDIYQAPIGNK